MIQPLEAAISLTGNAAAHLSVEQRKALMKHLNKDLKPLAEGDFPHRGPLLFGESFASKAKSTEDNVKALKGFWRRHLELVAMPTQPHQPISFFECPGTVDAGDYETRREESHNSSTSLSQTQGVSIQPYF